MKIIFLCIICTISLNAQQYINSVPEIGIQERYAGSIINSGVGNMGFDNYDGFYNPKYIERNGNISVSLIGNLELNSKKQFTLNYFSNDNSKSFLPNLQLSYTSKDILFQFHLMNSLLVNQTFKSNQDFFVEFNDGSNGVILGYNNVAYNAYNYNLQIDASYKFNDRLSISGGISTNLYRQKIEIERIFLPKISTIVTTNKLFDNIHFITSLNYSINDTKVYFYYKSKIGNTQLKSDEIKIYGNNYNIYSELEFPGILAFGLQQKVLENFKLSLEYKQDLSENRNSKYKYLIPGINIKVTNSITIGGLLAYNANKNPNIDFFNNSITSDSENTYYYTLAITYNIKKISFLIDYKHLYSGRDSIFSQPFENYYYDSIETDMVKFGINILI